MIARTLAVSALVVIAVVAAHPARGFKPTPTRTPAVAHCAGDCDFTIHCFESERYTRTASKGLQRGRELRAFKHVAGEGQWRSSRRALGFRTGFCTFARFGSAAVAGAVAWYLAGSVPRWPSLVVLPHGFDGGDGSWRERRSVAVVRGFPMGVGRQPPPEPPLAVLVARKSARQVGIEPTTRSLEGCCSIH